MQINIPLAVSGVSKAFSRAFKVKGIVIRLAYFFTFILFKYTRVFSKCHMASDDVITWPTSGRWTYILSWALEVLMAGTHIVRDWLICPLYFCHDFYTSLSSKKSCKIQHVPLRMCGRKYKKCVFLFLYHFNHSLNFYKNCVSYFLKMTCWFKNRKTSWRKIFSTVDDRSLL